MWIRRSFSIDTLGTFFAVVLTNVLSASIGIIISRSLGPEGKGIISLVLLILGQISLIMTFGADVSLVHFAGRKRWQLRELASAALGLAICLGAFGSITASFMLRIFVPAVDENIYSGLAYVVVFMALMVPLGLATGFLRSLIRVSGRIIEDQVLSILAVTLNLFFVSIAVVLGLGVSGVLFGFLSSTIFVSAMAILLSYKFTVLRLDKLYEPEIWKQLLRYGIKLHVGSVLQSLNYRLDMYIIALFLGTASVGLYSVAVAMAEWLWLLPGVLGTVLMQRVATRSKENANAMMGSINRLTSASLFVGVVVWTIAGGQIIRFLYGEAFVDSYYPLVFLLPGVWALGLWKNFMNDLAVRGYPISKSYTAGVGIILTVILDMMLIPRWGLVGAAIASSIAYWAAFVSGLWYYRRVTKMRPEEILIPSREDLSIMVVNVRSGIQQVFAMFARTSL